MTSQPDVSSTPEIWRPGTGQDPARFLVNPGTVLAPGKHSAGALRHARSYIASGNSFFVFPVGTEGFRRSGQAQLGLHQYIGAKTVDGQTIHYEEGRIEVTGTFPGITSVDAMNDCIAILTSKPKNGLVLYMPGVFEREQYVLAESWDFPHDAEDRTHSIDYTITFVKIGDGPLVSDKPGTPPPPNPTAKSKPRGKPDRIFTVKDGARTLRAIAQSVYGDQSKWNQIVTLNTGQLASWQRSNAMNKISDLPAYQLPTFRWPIGTQFRY